MKNSSIPLPDRRPIFNWRCAMAIKPRRLYKPVSSSVSARLPSSARSMDCLVAHPTARLRSSLIGRLGVTRWRVSSGTALTSCNKLASSRFASERRSSKTLSKTRVSGLATKRGALRRNNDREPSPRFKTATFERSDLKLTCRFRRQLLIPSLFDLVSICVHSSFTSSTNVIQFSRRGTLECSGKDLADCLHSVRREHANPRQFLVREIGLFLSAGALYLTKSRFLRHAAELCFRYPEQQRNSFLRDIFRYLATHNFLPMIARDVLAHREL